MRFLLVLLICLCVRPCAAQSELHAPLVAIDSWASDSPLASPGLIECDAMVDGYNDLTNEIELRRFKTQPLQSIAISGGWMEELGGRGLSSGYTELSLGTGIPLGNFDNLLGVRPKMRIDSNHADPSIEVPSELYQFELEFFYRRPINDRLSLLVVLSPSVRSDLTTSDQALRIFALALLNWEAIPDRLTWSVGAVYLGRADLPVLPAIGLTWTPDRITRMELRFPSSKFAYRLAKNGGASETWAYLAGGLGGNTWAVTRANSTTDELSLRDLRLLAGIEKLVDGGGGWFTEAGFALGRRLEYQNDDTRIDLDNAILLQAGYRY